MRSTSALGSDILEKNHLTSVSFIRKVSIAYFELYAETVLMRTLANLYPFLKPSELISHTTSVNEVSIHTVFFFFWYPKNPRRTGIQDFQFSISILLPIKIAHCIFLQWSFNVPLKCNSSRSRVHCRYSLRSMRKTSASLPLLTMADIWHMGIWKFPEMVLFLSLLYACTYTEVVWEITHHCALLLPYKRKGKIHTCPSEYSLAGKGHCHIGARGSLSLGHEHSKTLNNHKVWQLLNTWFDELKFGQKYLAV